MTTEPDIIALADSDDIGMSRLVQILRSSHNVVFWKFGGVESGISADVTPNWFRFTQPGATISSEDFACARLVLSKRYRHQTFSLVRSCLANPEDRAFSEREWTSLLQGAILAEELRSSVSWANALSATALCENKVALMLRARRFGLRVPNFHIATLARPQMVSQKVVAKAISTNEQISRVRHFATTLLSSSQVADIDGVRLSTPSHLQQYVSAIQEIRGYYLLGVICAFALRPSPQHVDIRYALKTEMDPQPYELDLGVAEPIVQFIRQTGLNYCAFDLLVSESEGVYLVDLTPNGSWDYFETETDPMVSRALAEVVLAHI